MALLTLALVSCASVDQSDRDIPDRWSSAKCPPTEICGPQIDPETLVVAWLDASQNKEVADRPNQKEVTIQGRMEFTLDGESHTRSKWSFLVEEIGGKWFVINGYH